MFLLKQPVSPFYRQNAMVNNENFVSAPNTDPLPGDGSICLLCAKQNITCCRTEPYLAPLCFPLSNPEWRRMLPHKNLAVLSVPEDGVRYHEEEEASDAAADALMKNAPLEWEL